MYIVRPHVAAIMLLSLIIAIIFHRETKHSIRIIFLLFSSSVIFIFFPMVTDYVNIKIDYFSFSNTYLNFKDLILNKMIANSSDTAGINISSMNLFEIIFSFYFRPLPFESQNFFQFFTSIENTFLIIFFIIIILFRLFNFNNLKKNKYSSLQLWIYIGILTFAFSLTQANYGITSRQKWMVLPCLIFIFYSSFPNKNSLVKAFYIKLKK